MKEISVKALLSGKIVIAYFGKNGDYKSNHLATPVEIRLFGHYFCTYTSHGCHSRKLKGEREEAVYLKFSELDIRPVCILEKRPVSESKIKD